MCQLVKHLTVDFGSGCNLMVHGLEPHVTLCSDSMEIAWDSLSPSLSAPSLLALSVSLSKYLNKH